MPAYFCKVSYADLIQPLARCHKNIEIEIDSWDDMWVTIQKAHVEAFGRYNDQRKDFTIDFMIEIPTKD